MARKGLGTTGLGAYGEQKCYIDFSLSTFATFYLFAGQHLYVLGGVSSVEHGPVDNVECLDLETGQATDGTLRCTAHMGMAVAVCDSELLEFAQCNRRMTIH